MLNKTNKKSNTKKNKSRKSSKIKKKVSTKIKIKNGIKPINNPSKEKKAENKIKPNGNIINNKYAKIVPNIQGDVDSCESNENENFTEEIISLDDSLEKTLIKDPKPSHIDLIKRRNEKKINNIKSPNNKIIAFNYPNLFNSIIKNNLMRKTHNKLKTKNDSLALISAFSTEERTKNKKYYETMLTNNEVVEFNYEDEKDINNNNYNKLSTINYTLTNNTASFNVLNKEITGENANIFFSTKKGNKLPSNENKAIKIWLDNLNLVQYLDNFVQNDLCNIDHLIQQMKTSENKLNYEDIESLLKIHKPGHIYRILTDLEISAGIISPKVGNFLIKKISNHKKNKSSNNIKISISQILNEDNTCINCLRINCLNSYKKNDLNQFLSRYNISQFYQNFYHNGFDMINYIMAQMFSSEPIDEIILENCLHIYDANNREKVLKCLLSEKEKIIFFLNSEEFLKFEEKYYDIKYEDIIFEKNENNGNNGNEKNIKYEKIIFPRNNICSDCLIC